MVNKKDMKNVDESLSSLPLVLSSGVIRGGKIDGLDEYGFGS
jgi:hypothetical protein